jgi:hypothetical protein
MIKLITLLISLSFFPARYKACRSMWKFSQLSPQNFKVCIALNFNQFFKWNNNTMFTAGLSIDSSILHRNKVLFCIEKNSPQAKDLSNDLHITEKMINDVSKGLFHRHPRKSNSTSSGYCLYMFINRRDYTIGWCS